MKKDTLLLDIRRKATQFRTDAKSNLNVVDNKSALFAFNPSIQ